MVGRQLAHYRILEKAGSGSMGEVYKAEDERLKRIVALKVLPEGVTADQGRLDRFHREAETLAQLDHPNIVTIFSIDRVDEVPFLTMAWVEGTTLDRLIPTSGFGLEELLDIAVPLTEAVAAAHDRGVTHRDLKPSNVMRTEEGGIKVLDFGLAKSGAEVVSSSDETLTRDGALIGSVPYMSPEQVRGEAADVRSDVFSLGVVLYEMATGSRPFAGGAAELLTAILRDSPPPVDQVRPDLPRQLGRIVCRALNKDPDRRYQGAKGLRTELEDLRAEKAPKRGLSLQSVAVLPFVDMSPERDQGYFCEGIAEEVLSALSGVQTLHVAARSSSFHVRDKTFDVREIGRRLNVGAILDGSVRKAGSRVRITAQLINVADGYHLWTERYDRELEDIFAIQDEIAESVVQALELTLSPDEKQSLKKRRSDLEAYDYYLRGRQLVDRTSRDGFESALEMFRKAIEIDPEYAPAWAGIADSYAWLFGWYGAKEEDLREAESASRRAVELAPESAEAHVSRGHVLAVSADPSAPEAFERAIALNPRSFDAYWHYGRDCFRRGDYAKAAELLEKAAEARPEDYQALLVVRQVYLRLGDEESGLDASRRGLERARKRLELNPKDYRALYLGCAPLFELGFEEEARARAERALEIRPDDPSVLYNVGCAFSIAGELERAIDCIEAAARHHFGLEEWFEHDGDLDPLRDHPRFQKLMEWVKREY
jgi:non-specific serine/threonine protein kinase